MSHPDDVRPVWDPAAETADAAALRRTADARLAALSGRLGQSPFHRRQLASAGMAPQDLVSVDRLSEIPFCDKEQLRTAQEQVPPFGDHLAVDPDDVKCVYQTSGTSGAPAVIALTARDIETWTTIGARSYWAAGIRPESSVLTTFGAGPFVAGASHRVLGRIGCRVVPIGPGDTDRVLSALRRGLADTMLCTPTFALHLLDRSARTGSDPAELGLRRLVTGGEPGGGIASVRASLESGFGATVVEVMGIGDISSSLFGETSAQDGMFFCGQGHVWPELIDGEGMSLPFEPGVRGELVLTTLTREAMPLLRFRTRDIIEIVGVGGQGGRSGYRMRCVGRTDDMIIVRGVNLFPSAVQAIVGEFRPSTTGRACLVVDGTSVSIEPPVHVLVEVPDGPVAEGLAESIEGEVRNRLMIRITVDLVPQSEFDPAGYKTRGLIRRPGAQDASDERSS